jgi:spore maturation protein CgeB
MTYGSIKECIEKARWYIAYDEEREQIAEAGRRRAVGWFSVPCRREIVMSVISFQKLEVFKQQLQ